MKDLTLSQIKKINSVLKILYILGVSFLNSRAIPFEWSDWRFYAICIPAVFAENLFYGFVIANARWQAQMEMKKLYEK